jgi:tRNA-(ms[2]io[6]A)-hydroxylase
MRLLELALADRDPDLSRWYHELVASEARHQDLFVRLAKEIFPADEVERRLVEIADHEARVVASLDPLPRMHT